MKATIEAVKAEKGELLNMKANLEDKISQQVWLSILVKYFKAWYLGNIVQVVFRCVLFLYYDFFISVIGGGS